MAHFSKFVCGQVRGVVVVVVVVVVYPVIVTDEVAVESHTGECLFVYVLQENVYVEELALETL